MSPRILFFLVLCILGMAGFAAQAGIKVYEGRILDDEFSYADGSARFRLRARRPRNLALPDE